jgi:hypothetical protein
LITADSGGSNGSRLRLWKTELAGLAAETGLEITVVHLPPVIFSSPSAVLDVSDARLCG